MQGIFCTQHILLSSTISLAPPSPPSSLAVVGKHLGVDDTTPVQLFWPGNRVQCWWCTWVFWIIALAILDHWNVSWDQLLHELKSSSWWHGCGELNSGHPLRQPQFKTRPCMMLKKGGKVINKISALFINCSPFYSWNHTVFQSFFSS